VTDAWIWSEHPDRKLDPKPFTSRDPDAPICGAQLPASSFVCTRDPHPAGRHIACGGWVAAAWPGVHEPTEADVEAQLPGSVAVTVRILTPEDAERDYPDLFEYDVLVNITRFQPVSATGPGAWTSRWPDAVLVVANTAGQVLVACEAASWHLKGLGYRMPEVTT